MAAQFRSHMKYSSSVIFPRRCRFVQVAILNLSSTSSPYPRISTLYCRCCAARSNSTFGYASFSLQQRSAWTVSDCSSFGFVKIAQNLVRSALASPNDSIGHFFIVFFLKCPHIPLPLPITVLSLLSCPPQIISAFPHSVSSFLLYLLQWHRFSSLSPSEMDPVRANREGRGKMLFVRVFFLLRERPTDERREKRARPWIPLLSPWSHLSRSIIPPDNLIRVPVWHFPPFRVFTNLIRTLRPSFQPRFRKTLDISWSELSALSLRNWSFIIHLFVIPITSWIFSTIDFRFI